MKKSICALSLAAVTSVSMFAGCNSGTQDYSTQYKNTFNVNDRVIYNNGTVLIDITDPDKPSFPCLAEEKSETSDSPIPGSENITKAFTLDCKRSIINGNEAISGELSNYTQIYHYDLSDTTNVKRTILYDEGSWVGPVKAKLGSSYSEEDIKEISDYMKYRSSDWSDGGDGYIYFDHSCGNEHFNSYKKLNYIVGRFSKDGKGMEIMNDITACSIALKDGYIYYADSGYTLDGKENYSADKGRMGIYKVKTDGTDKQKLADIAPYSNLTDSELWTRAVGRLEIVNNDLYYIAENNSEDTYLYKLSLSGGQPQQVITESVSDYYVDTASGTIYYQDGQMYCNSASGNTFYSMSIATGEKKALFTKLSAQTGVNWMSVAGDYLYISDRNRFKAWKTITKGENVESDDPSGQRFNLKTGEMEYLECYTEVEKEVDILGVEKIKSVGPMNMNWKKYIGRPVENGVTIYV